MAAEWNEVSTEDHPAWRAVFNSEPQSETLAGPCPLCGASTLHRWYSVDGLDDIEIGGQHYIGRGRLWEWCSSCRAYEHFRDGYVPEWWRSSLVVPENELAYDPGPIEAALRGTAR
jgi:hypothetical protein